MKEIKKVLRLGKVAYYETHLSIINCLLPVKMTPMEIKVMAAFMSLEGDLAQHRFGPTAKKIVMSSTNLDKPLSAAGLTNYIGPLGSLTKKGFLIRSGDLINILPILLPEAEQQIYLLKLENLG